MSNYIHSSVRTSSFVLLPPQTLNLQLRMHLFSRGITLKCYVATRKNFEKNVKLYGFKKAFEIIDKELKGT